jgi:copper chaperone CopZ
MDMKKLALAAALMLGTTTAFAAESLKATVGHMCCGGCKAAATAPVKALDWVDTVAIDGDVVTVTAKADQKVDLVALTNALNKGGFPAREIMVSGPVTFTAAHLCCAGCVNDLKTKMAAVRSELLDKEKIVIDGTAKTITLQPVAGKSMNIVPIISQMARAGFSASKATVSAAAAAATK